MPSAYTTLLGLVQPTSGELNNTWGGVLNAQLTQLVEDAIAGVSTYDVTAGNWTLSTTASGAQNEARTMTLIPTGTAAVARTIYAPKLSKVYVVINRSLGPVTVSGGPTTPTTGTAVAAGVAAIIAWDTNTGDFVTLTATSTGSTSSDVFIENDVFLESSLVLGQSAQAVCTISNASPAVVTQANTFLATQPVFFTTAGTLPTGLSVNTTYFVSATGLSAASFQVAATAGGASINTSSAGSGVFKVGKAKSGSMVGPLTIPSGKTLTVPSGQRAVVL